MDKMTATAKIQIPTDENTKIFVGTDYFFVQPLSVYSGIVCDFLQELSKTLRELPEARLYPDILAFAFWCRRGNIQKLKQDMRQDRLTRGRGIVFHIAPSNVPVNFAFTFAFGLLAGNANIVRVSSKEFEQVNIICSVIRSLFEQEKYGQLAKQNVILSYDKADSDITEKLSGLCDVRVIWGGDVTIASVRRYPLKSKAIELVFADRFSFGVLDCRCLCDCSDNELSVLADYFYNDTFLMDQNACSTPHLLFFLTAKDDGDTQTGILRFWESVYRAAKEKYPLEDIKASDKYLELCKIAVERPECRLFSQRDNILYVVDIENFRENTDITCYRGRYGMFYQHCIHSLDEIESLINQKVQSMMYYGISQDSIIEFLNQYSLMGIDRVVPFGKALDVDVFWDGYDIITQMSRIISVNQ